MSEPTKADLEATNAEMTAELNAVRAENENLRGQLAASGARRPPAVEHPFVLSQGELAELETYGVTNHDGQRLTREQALTRMAASDDQRGVQIAEPKADLAASLPAVRPNLGLPGVDYVYPSVRPGAIDPAVAGTPGISGPAATVEQMDLANELAPAPGSKA